jgi:myosin X
VPPDEAVCAQRGEWSFVVHARRKSYILSTKNPSETNRWVNAIQDVIDNSPVIETPTEKLIDELKIVGPDEVASIYQTHKVLLCSYEPLRTPLLALPYGETTSTPSGRQYGTLQEEAIKVSTSLLPVQEPGKGSATRYGTPSQPIPLIKAIIQSCFDVPKLRNEVYCQVIKLTTSPPAAGSALNLMHWHLLASMCSSFMPARKYIRFLRFHLRRTIDDPDVHEEVSDLAAFCLELLKRTKTRDFPPSTVEITAIMSRKPIPCVVNCVGGRYSCKSSIVALLIGELDRVQKLS